MYIIEKINNTQALHILYIYNKVCRFPQAMRTYGADKAPKALMEDKPYNRSSNADMQIVQIRLLRIIEYKKYAI